MLLRPKLRPPPPASTTAAPNAAHVPATIQSTGTTHCPASMDGGTPQCYSMQDHARHAAQMRTASACPAGRQAGLAHEGNAFAGNTRGQTGLSSLSHLMFRGTADIDSSLLSSRKPSRGERRQNTVPPHLQSQIDIGGPRRPNSTRSHDAYAAAARKTSSASYVGRSDPFGSDHPCSSPAVALPAAGIRTNLPVPLSSVIFDGTRGIEKRQPTSRSAALAEEHMRSEVCSQASMRIILRLTKANRVPNLNEKPLIASVSLHVQDLCTVFPDSSSSLCFPLCLSRFSFALSSFFCSVSSLSVTDLTDLAYL
eukprot:6187548-Pleurochrysis_carterae.AAC.2